MMSEHRSIPIRPAPGKPLPVGFIAEHLQVFPVDPITGEQADEIRQTVIVNGILEGERQALGRSLDLFQGLESFEPPEEVLFVLIAIKLRLFDKNGCHRSKSLMF